MKTGVFALLLSVVLVGGVAVAILSGRGISADSARSEALMAEQATRVAALDATIDQLNDQVARLADRLKLLEEGSARRTAIGTSGRVSVASSEESGSEADAELAPLAEEPRLTLAQVLQPEQEKMLREYVAQVYLDARNQRREEEQKLAAEKQKEWEALGEGPYGEHNRRVNTLGKALGWNDLQKYRYHALLLGYLDRQKALANGLDMKDPESRKEMRRQSKLLGEEFDAVVLNTLTPEQAEIFGDLSPDQKGLGAGDMGGLVQTIRMDDGALIKTLQFNVEPGQAALKLEAVEHAPKEPGGKVQ